MPRRMRERAPTWPRCAQTELQLRMAAETGLSVCTLRAGAYYGHVAMAGWIRDSAAGQPPRAHGLGLGPYDVATPWVYVHDLAQTLERVASQRHRLGSWVRLHFCRPAAPRPGLVAGPGDRSPSSGAG